MSVRVPTPGSGRGASKRPAAACRPADVLGAEHPVACAAHWRGVFVGQAMGTSVLLVLAIVMATIERDKDAITLASSALAVECWIVAAAALATTLLHERARDVIADGGCGWDVAEVRDERARLTGRSNREQLARSLERAVDQADHWRQTPIATRPPNGVRQLVKYRGAAIEIARLVRDPASDVRGVALLDRLIGGGYASSLYTGAPQTLQHELHRIQFLLAIRDT